MNAGGTGRRRRPGRSNAPLLTALGIAVIIAVRLIQGPAPPPPAAPPGAETTGSAARCVKVTDGDTVDVRWPDGRKDRVRVLGIDCPETHNDEKRAQQARTLGVAGDALLRLGRDATAVARGELLNRDVVVVVPRGGDARDPYGRLLAYVEVGGVDYGAALISRGLAEARREPHPRRDDYHALARKARERQVGIHNHE